MKSFKMMTIAAGMAAFIAGCSVQSPMTSQDQVSPPASEAPVAAEKTANPATVLSSSSASLAHSYETLEDLETASVLIAEVSIQDVLRADKENEYTFYNAAVTDVLKGAADKKEIVLAQVGVEGEREQTREFRTERGNSLMQENPPMNAGESYILFLKAGDDDSVGPMYYVAGEYQGKYRIEDGQVYSVNPKAQTKATISGENVDAFKEKVKDVVKSAE